MELKELNILDWIILSLPIIALIALLTGYPNFSMVCTSSFVLILVVGLSFQLTRRKIDKDV